MAKKMVPPDGGFGWVIVIAHALFFLILVPVMQSFGLVFKDTFVDMGFTATDGSIIINTNAAASMMTGLINGPLLKYFGYRKVSYAGAFFTTLGVLLTAYANSFSSFLITYGIITCYSWNGNGNVFISFGTEHLLRKKRSKAAGITMTITGLGPVLMPQLISLLLFLYGVYGCVIVLGGVAAHSFIAASLLQPVKWHMVEEVPDEENANGESNVKKDETMTTLLETPEKDPNGMYDKQNEIMQSLASLDHEVQAIYGMDTPLGSMLSLNQVGTRRRLSSTNFKSIQEDKWPSVSSITKKTETRNASVKQSLGETKDEKYTMNPPEKPYNPEMTIKITDDKKQEEGLIKMVLAKIVNMFDLELLKDPIYVNIMIGMSLAVFAEINFSLQTPFILVDFDMSTYEIATFLSILSTADICFRFLAPFIGDFLNKPARIMYMFSLLFLIATRFSMFLFTDYYHLLGVAVALGVAKGVRTVYWTLVIPNYVPIEKLANALGLQMMVNGVFILFGGPILGMIRDATGSYKNGIFVLNCVTITTVIMWSIEMLYLRYKSKRVQES